MYDLFLTNKTPEEKIKELITNIKEHAKKDGLNLRRKITAGFGNFDNIGNNVLIVTDPPESKYFDSGEDRRLYKILKDFEINKYFHTYYFWYKKNTKLSKSDVKKFGFWIKMFTNIIEPNLIVCLGETAQLSFLTVKSILRDNHGKQIGVYNEIPIYTSYPVSYYNEKSECEDHTYKHFIKNKDWSLIKEKYDKVVKNDSI
jgi:uracil-DNA glycosylase